MKQGLIKSAVRSRFFLTSRRRASNQIRASLQHYLSLAERIGPEAGRRMVRVPPMLGVDEDMRNWSFFMILEHNVIVNRSISSIVGSLARGEQPADNGIKDPKKDVMPSSDPGAEQIEALQASIDHHLAAVSALDGLRKTATSRHPIFGHLNAHGWHCMFGLHLDIHRRQAEAVRQALA